MNSGRLSRAKGARSASFRTLATHISIQWIWTGYPKSTIHQQLRERPDLGSIWLPSFDQLVSSLLQIKFDRAIMTGEELTCDYNFHPFNQKNVQGCYCGEPQCRGFIAPKQKQEGRRTEEEENQRPKFFKKRSKRKIVEAVGQVLGKVAKKPKTDTHNVPDSEAKTRASATAQDTDERAHPPRREGSLTFATAINTNMPDLHVRQLYDHNRPFMKHQNVRSSTTPNTSALTSSLTTVESTCTATITFSFYLMIEMPLCGYKHGRCLHVSQREAAASS
jgi:hypothetical protein